MIRAESKHTPRVILSADIGASRVPNMKSDWEAYFSMIYVSGFLGFYEFVEVSQSASNPVSWRLASHSRKSVTLVCEDTPKNSRMSTNSRFCRSLRCTNSVSRKLRITLIGGHAQRQIQIELDAERSNLGGFCVREKSRRVLDAASTTIGSQWPSLCLVLSL